MIFSLTHSVTLLLMWHTTTKRQNTFIVCKWFVCAYTTEHEDEEHTHSIKYIVFVFPVNILCCVVYAYCVLVVSVRL